MGAESAGPGSGAGPEWAEPKSWPSEEPGPGLVRYRAVVYRQRSRPVHAGLTTSCQKKNKNKK